ncbi:hypothetical protein Agabi119p4_5004 [Agaricus bisporus var. burnettii]|uniref:Uncharacterized protein n=1 Tax=Agaricus bisporus var. burnettii TaxID=192524 RepID=A0A8H7KHV7_AGABI|nr:hypothetical protein Agabi119p4_5004 [Agaricus bisporus var. burnettii]
MPKYDGPRTGLPNEDGRNGVLHAFVEADKYILHPRYRDLVSLFQNLAAAILPDYHWAADFTRQRPDFVHEILQRMILNFVVEKKDALFMDYKTANENRKFDGGMKWYHVLTNESDCRRSSSINSSVSSQGRKRKLKEMVPDPEELADVLSVVDESNDDGSDYGGRDEDTHRSVKKSRKKYLVMNVEPE